MLSKSVNAFEFETYYKRGYTDVRKPAQLTLDKSFSTFGYGFVELGDGRKLFVIHYSTTAPKSEAWESYLSAMKITLEQGHSFNTIIHTDGGMPTREQQMGLLPVFKTAIRCGAKRPKVALFTTVPKEEALTHVTVRTSIPVMFSAVVQKVGDIIAVGPHRVDNWEQALHYVEAADAYTSITRQAMAYIIGSVRKLQERRK